jgi:EPS-associated MarR family transcriptional regulator
VNEKFVILPAVDLEFEAIRALHHQPSLTQRQLASTLGVSVGRAHYCLRALIEKGLVKAKNYRTSQNKAAYLYLLTPRGVVTKAAMTRRFLERKVEEYDALAVEIDRVRRESAVELESAG